MATIVIENNSRQAQELLNYVRTLPFVRVIKDNENGLAEKPVKWTEKMQQSFAQAKRGEVVSRSLEELLDV